MLNIPKNIQTELAGNSYSINPLVVIYLDYEDIFGVDVTQEEPNIYIHNKTIPKNNRRF